MFYYYLSGVCDRKFRKCWKVEGKKVEVTCQSSSENIVPFRCISFYAFDVKADDGRRRLVAGVGDDMEKDKPCSWVSRIG